MGKTWLYIVILLILSAGIYILIFKGEASPFGKSEAGFTIKDTASIGKVFIAGNTGETILLERKPGYWQLNGRYKALPSLTDLVLKTLATQEALYPIPESAVENAIHTLATEGVKVEVYDKYMKKISVFYVGGSFANGKGTEMLMEGAKKPFVVQTPAFNGSLSSRYSTQLSDWRDRTVFNVPESEIVSASVTYTDLPLNSFTILRKSDGGLNMTVSPEVMGKFGELNTTRAAYFLTYFTNVNCEGYMNGLIGMDSSIKYGHRMSVVELVKRDGTRELADIYWMPINKRSKNQVVSDRDVSDLYDADRLYALINDRRDTVMIQMQAFKRIFRHAYEFYEHGDRPVQAKK